MKRCKALMLLATGCLLTIGCGPIGYSHRKVNKDCGKEECCGPHCKCSSKCACKKGKH